MKMQEKIELAYGYMQDVSLKEGRDWISPTEIGIYVSNGKSHSAFGSPICKKMVEQGLVERNQKGWYKVV